MVAGAKVSVHKLPIKALHMLVRVCCVELLKPLGVPCKVWTISMYKLLGLAATLMLPNYPVLLNRLHFCVSKEATCDPPEHTWGGNRCKGYSRLERFYWGEAYEGVLRVLAKLG